MDIGRQDTRDLLDELEYMEGLTGTHCDVDGDCDCDADDCELRYWL